MKNVFVITVIATVFVLFSSCERCYKCHNLCQRCSYSYPDTTLVITVCSEKLTEKYYIEYIDSLTAPSLGWTCTEANSNYSERFCGSSSNNSIKLITKKDEGLICSPE